jgi:hypothetical protein
MEQEKRGVYAGAVGRFDFNSNELDTCIAIRTMTFKDGVAYLQSGEPHLPRGYVASAPNAHYGRKGGGIVFDSIEEDEYVETINKLGANVRCIDAAEGTLPRPRAEDGETSVEGLTTKIPSQNTIIICSRNSDRPCYNRACNAVSDARPHEFDNDSFNTSEIALT